MEEFPLVSPTDSHESIAAPVRMTFLLCHMPLFPPFACCIFVQELLFGSCLPVFQWSLPSATADSRLKTLPSWYVAIVVCFAQHKHPPSQFARKTQASFHWPAPPPQHLLNTQSKVHMPSRYSFHTIQYTYCYYVPLCAILVALAEYPFLLKYTEGDLNNFVPCCYRWDGIPTYTSVSLLVFCCCLLVRSMHEASPPSPPILSTLPW